MQLRRLQPYLLSLALVLLVVPLQAHAQVAELVNSVLSGLNTALMNVAYLIVINALGLLVWFAASLLDFGVNTFVIGFGNTFAYTGIGIAVDQTWVIIRDFVNMFFIFGFVYIGFKMILNSSDSNTRRWLVNILLAALLVNFSLFVTKFTIDMSNQLAAQIAVNGLTDGTEIFVTQPDGSRLRQIDLTSSFMARMGISSVYGLNFDTVRGAGWGYVFGTAILFLTAAFVFAAGGILLIIRFAMLNIFMMLSPVMFMSWILPPLKDTMDRFWSQFIGKALFAPIYLMFIYFSLQVISGLQVSVGRGGNTFAKPDWQGTFQAIEAGAKGGTSTSSMLGTLPFFILICVFLALSLIIADKLGMEGGSKAVSLGKSFANRVRKTAVNNSAGFAMRGVNRLSESAQGGYERLDASLATGKGLGWSIARGARNTLNVATMGATSNRALQGTFAAGQKARIDGSELASEVDQRKIDRQKTQNKTIDQMDRAKSVKDNLGVDTEDAKAKLALAIKNMSDDELKDFDLDKLKDSTVARHLSDAQIKMLKESGLYSNEDIKGLKTARDESTFSETDKVLGDVNASAADLDTAFDDLSKTIKGLSEERLQNMNFDKLKNENFASNLSEAQIESLQKSGNFTSQQMQVIRTSRETGLGKIVNGTATSRYSNDSASLQDKRKQNLFSRSTEEIGKLPVSVFKDSASFKNITPAMLEARIKNGISGTDSTAIRNALFSHHGATSAAGLPEMWKKWKSSNSAFAAQFFS